MGLADPPVNYGVVCPTRACGLRTRSSPAPGIDLRGLVPRPDSAVYGGPPFHLFRFSRFSLTRATHEG